MKLKSAVLIAAVSTALLLSTGCRSTEYGGVHPGYGHHSGGHQYSGTITTYKPQHHHKRELVLAAPAPRQHHGKRELVVVTPPSSGGNQYSGSIGAPSNPPSSGGTHSGYASNQGGNQYGGSIGGASEPVMPPQQGNISGGSQYGN